MMQLNKTDPNDAFGLARIVRCGWDLEVEVKSIDSNWVRLLLSSCRSSPSGPHGLCAPSPSTGQRPRRPSPLQVQKKPVCPVLPSETTSAIHGVLHLGDSMAVRLVLSAQITRAFSFATATQAFAVPSFLCFSTIHWLRLSVFLEAKPDFAWPWSRPTRSIFLPAL